MKLNTENPNCFEYKTTKHQSAKKVFLKDRNNINGWHFHLLSCIFSKSATFSFSLFTNAS